MCICGFVVSLAKRSVGSIKKIKKVTSRQLTIFKLHCIVMFKWLSLNNFCISFLIFLLWSHELLKTLLIHRLYINQYLFLL